LALWQATQLLALKIGPKPSRAVVLAGALTQACLAKLLPTTQSSCSSKLSFGWGCSSVRDEIFASVKLPPLAMGNGWPLLHALNTIALPHSNMTDNTVESSGKV
tara:strand:- start:204 stop:515 length:312 start_codon:yes stop_codon:yes gene_type:complete